VKGTLRTANLSNSYLWPGTLNAQSGNPAYPDASISYYRIQQRALMNGMTSHLLTAPGGDGTPYNSTIIQVVKNGVNTGFSMGYGGPENGVRIKSTLSVDLALGDLLSVELILTGLTGGNSNGSHDLSVQLDIF
jgi:hypothetical protein